MIVLDTHIWVWWASDPDRLSKAQRAAIKVGESEGMAVSAISCWELAMLASRGRIDLGKPVLPWLISALAYPGIESVGLSPEIATASAQLPGSFHKDPSDQIIVATARILSVSLVTSDRKIVAYEHVETIG